MYSIMPNIGTRKNSVVNGSVVLAVWCFVTHYCVIIVLGNDTFFNRIYHILFLCLIALLSVNSKVVYCAILF